MTKKYTIRNEMIRRDFAAGMRPTYIAEKYGISRQRVYIICAGVEVVVNLAPNVEAAIKKFAEDHAAKKPAEVTE